MANMAAYNLWLYYLTWQIRDFVDVLKVMDLEVGESPVLSRYAQYNHESLYKREAGESRVGTDVMMEAEVRKREIWRCYTSALKTEEGVTSQGMKADSRTERGRKWIL